MNKVKKDISVIIGLLILMLSVAIVFTNGGQSESSEDNLEYQNFSLLKVTASDFYNKPVPK